MKTLKKSVYFLFILGFVLSAFMACDDDENQRSVLLSLSSYEEKVKIGDSVSIQVSLSDPSRFSKILIKKTISGKEISDYTKELNVANLSFPYTFNAQVVSGDENGVVVYSFYGLDVNGAVVDASDLVLTVDLAELPLLLKYDWQLVQQMIQGEDFATPDLKDDIYRFNADLTLELDWGTIFSAAQLETLNSCCSWDVERTGEKIDSLYLVKYNIQVSQVNR